MDRMVRLSEDSYAAVLRLSAQLELRLGRKVSLSEAIEYLASRNGKRARAFWSKLRDKRVVGRGRKRTPLGTTVSSLKTPLVHVHLRKVHADMNRRFP